jgi:hypothetical protein
MRRNRQKSIHIVKYQGLVPFGMSKEEEVISVPISSTWHQSSNYSWNLRSSIAQTMGLHTGGVNYCNSGGTKFTYKGGLIVESNSGMILTLPVKDPLGNILFMVSDQFDTPRHRRQWRAMRAHFRRAMYTIVNDRRDVKMVKVPHNFLQKFKIHYNYVPSFKQMDTLKKRILIGARGDV